MDDELTHDEVPDDDPEYVNPHPEEAAIPDVPQHDQPTPKNDAAPED